MTKTRIFLADDHETVREGLKSIVNAEPDMEVVGETADGRTLLNDVRGLAPDLVVMDLSMPHLNGLAATRMLRAALPAIKIVVLTRHSEQGYLQQMRRAGAAGYVLKQSRVVELLAAIRTVVAGGTFLDPALSATANGDLRGADAVDWPPGRALTSREDEVLRLVAWGHSNKEIAAELSLSVKTVETHKANAMHKLGMHSRIDVVRYGLHRGWLQDV